MFKLFERSHVDFISSSNAQAPLQPNFNHLQNFIARGNTATLLLELKSVHLTEDEIKTLAVLAIKKNQPDAYLALAETHPQVITSYFTMRSLVTIKPSNAFLTPFIEQLKEKNEESPLKGLPIYEAEKLPELKIAMPPCMKSAITAHGLFPYVVHQGEIHDSSYFNNPCVNP